MSMVPVVLGHLLSPALSRLGQRESLFYRPVCTWQSQKSCGFGDSFAIVGSVPPSWLLQTSFYPPCLYMCFEDLNMLEKPAQEAVTRSVGPGACGSSLPPASALSVSHMESGSPCCDSAQEWCKLLVIAYNPILFKSHKETFRTIHVLHSLQSCA